MLGWNLFINEKLLQVYQYSVWNSIITLINSIDHIDTRISLVNIMDVSEDFILIEIY